ncbi:MAG: EAL domain-containing protein [Arcobacteraceae bacterium]|nr:EAL domain-containing protein [Arcobacteraceae bacterium]
MSLSKQLYIIISFIFFMIFTGNFIISVNNTKEYLELESTTKAQDTATSLGMSLKSLMTNKQDPQIQSIISAIANRGFYKEIRLEDVATSFTNEDLIQNSKLTDHTDWEVSNVTVDKNYGEIEQSNSDDITNELALLENEATTKINTKKLTYSFIPNKNFIDGDNITINFQATNNHQTVNATSTLNITKIIAKVTRAEKFDYIPQWFINLIPLKMSEMKSEISNGWNTTAIIYVSANAGDAYAKLYEQAKGAIVYAIIAFTFSILLLVIFLRFILKPLKNIETLAQSISKGKFEIIKHLPWTTELKSVSIAMNDMSSKIEGVIKKLNANLESMTQKLSLDELTGLHLRQTFETDMKKMFISKETGYVFIVKIDDLSSYAKNHTNKEVDKFLIYFTNILKNLSPKVTAYRFYGSEFAMIAKNIEENEIKQVIHRLKIALESFAITFNITDVAHIGGTPFNPIGTTPGIIASANEAYEKAKLIGANEAFIRDDNDLARDMNEWRDLVFDIIDNQKFNISYIGQAYCLDMKEQNLVVMEEAFTQAKDKNNELIPIGTFISIAEKYDKILDFDKAVVKKVIQHIKDTSITHSISINLSLDSVFDIKFKNWLKGIVLENKEIASQLVFSVTAYGAAKDVETFKYFIEAIHKAGAKIIIKRFETKFIPLDNIKDFNLDYIRLARDYTDGICKDSSKKGFVEAMQELSSLLTIKVFAENVKDDDDFEIVKDIGLYGASR